MQTRDKWVHFVMSQEELERMQQKMDELGIRNKSSYLRKMALDGYCVNLELDDVKEISVWNISARWSAVRESRLLT